MSSAFPSQPFDTAADYVEAYRQEITRAWASVDGAAVAAAAAKIRDVMAADGTIYACGNGGSAAISNHLWCDFAKGIRTDTDVRPRVVSLSACVELITAIANDIAYEDVFAHQLQSAARPGDLLLTVSASGNSENVVRAIDWANGNGLETVALTGFDGGRSAANAAVNIHVDARNYGVVEDVHQSMMHVLAQYLRMAHMDPADVAKRFF